MVMIFVSHTKGSRFDPGLNQFLCPPCTFDCAWVDNAVSLFGKFAEVGGVPRKLSILRLFT